MSGEPEGFWKEAALRSDRRLEDERKAHAVTRQALADLVDCWYGGWETWTLPKRDAAFAAARVVLGEDTTA